MNLPLRRAERRDALVPIIVGLAALAPPKFMMRAQFILEQAAFLDPELKVPASIATGPPTPPLCNGMIPVYSKITES